jgi:hypothetical protein
MTDLTDADHLAISKVTTKWLVRPEKYPGPYADELFAAGKAAGQREGMEEAAKICETVHKQFGTDAKDGANAIRAAAKG